MRAKALKETADKKMEALSNALMAASDNGQIPVLCDTSPCLMRIKNYMVRKDIRGL